ncbi:MAG TPA: hypothetical protein VLA62_00790 [Solirubrobacterales bacterium]|nr:hypothetical protein [Solirubrobacterales bacterium]
MDHVRGLTYSVREWMATAVKRSRAERRAQGKVRWLWARDGLLGTGKDEARWLGWLGVANDQVAHLAAPAPAGGTPRRPAGGAW